MKKAIKLLIKTAAHIALILCPFVAKAQVSVSLSPVPKLQFLNNAGQPLASGCVFFYAAGTTTPQAAYTDSTGTAQLSNPLILDAGGFSSPTGIWLANQSYKIKVVSAGGVNCATGVTQYTIDGISSALGLLNLVNTWTASNTFQQPVIITPNANQLVLGAPAAQTTLNAPAPAGNITINLPSVADTLVGRTTTDVLTNKTLTSPTITNPSTTGTDSGSETLVNKSLTAPIMSNPSFVQVTSANAPAPTFNAAVFWAETPDNFLHFNVNSTGTQQIPEVIMLNTAYTNSTTNFSNVTDGTRTLQFTASANRIYTALCHLNYQAAATGGLNIQWTSTQTPTVVAYSLNEPLSSSAWNLQAANSLNTSLGAAITTAATSFDATVVLAYISNPSGGTITLQAKSSAAAALTINAGSYCTIQ